jgi:pimeloyl-ACP methyl ester carboxylesterase
MSASGKSPAIAQEGKYTLDEEVTFLAPVFQAAGDSFHLIGHSFGGAVALKAALKYRERTRSLTLFEPTLFKLLVSNAPNSSAAYEILKHRESTSGLADLGQYEAAAEEFVDYWFRRGAWAATPEEVRTDIRSRIGLVRQRWDALFCDSVTLADIASIDIPTLYLTAADSNMPTRSLSELVSHAMPQARKAELHGVGHMAPLSDPDRVNPLIEAFLREIACL